MRGKWLTRANLLGCLGILALMGLLALAVFMFIILKITYG